MYRGHRPTPQLAVLIPLRASQCVTVLHYAICHRQVIRVNTPKENRFEVAETFEFPGQIGIVCPQRTAIIMFGELELIPMSDLLKRFGFVSMALYDLVGQSVLSIKPRMFAFIGNLNLLKNAECT